MKWPFLSTSIFSFGVNKNDISADYKTTLNPRVALKNLFKNNSYHTSAEVKSIP